MPGQLRQLRAHGRRYGIAPDAHELGHGVGGHVVGPDRVALAIARVRVVRIESAAQHPADDAHLRLCHRDHVRTLTVDAVLVRERLRRPVDLDAGVEQLVDHLRHGQRVVLLGGDYVGLHLGRRAALGLAPGLQMGVPEQRLAVAARLINERPRGNLLVLDDVADAPPPALPEAWHRRLGVVGRQAAGAAADLIAVHEDRRRQPRAGRFGQHSGDVVERGNPVEAHVAPPRVDGRADDAGLAGLFELVAHVAAVPAHLAPHERIGIRPDRLGVRRDRDARTAAAHLVMVHVGLGCPVAKENLRGVLRLDHVLHERVAVVVVPHVLLVEPRKGRRFVLGAGVLHVPVGYHLRPVRVEGRDDDLDDVVERAPRVLVVAREALVQVLGGGLGRGDLTRMQRETLHDHGAAVRDELPHVRLRQAARIRQPGVGPPEALEPGEIGRRRDEKREKRLPLGGRTQFHHLHPVGALLEQPVVGDEPVPTHKLAVGAHLVAEMLLGGGEPWCLRRPGASQQTRPGQEERQQERGSTKAWASHRKLLCDDGGAPPGRGDGGQLKRDEASAVDDRRRRADR